MKVIKSYPVKQHRPIGDHVIAYLDTLLGVTQPKEYRTYEILIESDNPRDWDKPDWDARRIERALSDLDLPECECVFYHNPILVEHVTADNGKRYLKITVTLVGYRDGELVNVRGMAPEQEPIKTEDNTTLETCE